PLGIRAVRVAEALLQVIGRKCLIIDAGDDLARLGEPPVAGDPIGDAVVAAAGVSGVGERPAGIVAGLAAAVARVIGAGRRDLGPGAVGAPAARRQAAVLDGLVERQEGGGQAL